MSAGGPRVFLVAAEESGDRLGAALSAALRRRAGEGLRLAGVGGSAMARAGVPSLVPVDDLATVGLGIVRRLPRILRRIAATAAAVRAARPDVLVIIDSPEFTHRVARRVRAADPTIPIINYVSPSVWAWRPWRARAMRAYVDHVLALLPFEPQAHATLGGPPCSYVGHPLTEQLALLRPSAEEDRRRHAAPPLLLLLPGSRRNEIRRLLPVFGEALHRLVQRCGPVEAVLPAVAALAGEIGQAIAAWPLPPRLVTEEHEKYAAFRSARAALAKSGTVTLELALAGVPMIAAYRLSAFEAALARRLIRVPSVILANLVLGENVVPEFLQEDCTAPALAAALAPLLSDSAERRAQTAAFARLDAIMQIGRESPSERAADIVLRTALQGRASPLTGYLRRSIGT